MARAQTHSSVTASEKLSQAHSHAYTTAMKCYFTPNTGERGGFTTNVCCRQPGREVVQSHACDGAWAPQLHCHGNEARRERAISAS